MIQNFASSNFSRSGFLLILIIIVSGCQSLGVKPWQRDVLSRDSMQFQMNDLDYALDDHFYFSKEGIAGGRGFAGGGCGCN